MTCHVLQMYEGRCCDFKALLTEGLSPTYSETISCLADVRHLSIDVNVCLAMMTHFWVSFYN